MRSHAKASTAGSTQHRAGGLGRTALLALSAAAFLALFASPASAEIVVNLAGTGSGTVTSNLAGIECSNVGGGSPGPSCSASFGPGGVQLSAASGGDSHFIGWSGDDPAPGFFGPTCNTGSANPCTTIDPAAFPGFFPPGTNTHITATFDLLPDPPPTITGNASPGAEDWLRTLEGTVNPGGFKVSDCSFEYGTTTDYGTSVACESGAWETDEGNVDVPVSAETEPLEPNTTYHYRLLASNLGGTSHGEDRSFTTGPAPEGECENEARRQEQGIAALRLPNCMALEMVSPPQKFGAPAKFPNVSADGSRVSYRATAALGEDPPALVSFRGAVYVANRDGSGWSSEMTVPDLEPSINKQWGDSSESHPSFTPDFSRWFGVGATAVQKQQDIAFAYEGGLGSFFRPLSEPRMLPLNSEFEGASEDHSHLLLQAGGKAALLSGDPALVGSGVEPGNVYVARNTAGGQSAFELLNRDETGKVWGGNCGARLGGIGLAFAGGLPAPNGLRNQGAVSADGSRIYFSTRAAQPQSGNCLETSKLRILERIETPAGPEIFPLFASECSRPAPDECGNADGDDLYQGASVDQSKVYFTTNRQLASSDTDGSGAECDVLTPVSGCDLYLYDRGRPAGERLVQVSAGEVTPSHPTPGAGAGVFNGITAISADGSHVYFVATGVLTTAANPVDDQAQAGEPNLYLWDAESEEISFLGTLAPALSFSDKGDAIIFSDRGDGLWGGQGTWRNNAYPVPATDPDGQGGDGHILLFESKAELSPNDADGRRRDVYRYDSEAQTLQCLSCAPGSSEAEPDEAPLDVDDRGDERPLGTDFAESYRWASEDGEEVGFMTPQALLPGDVDDDKDGYLWRDGELFRLPGVPFGGSQIAAGIDGPFLSHDGSTVAFATETPLLTQDGDTAADIYVAREGGGFPNPPAPTICEPGVPGKECQEPAKPPTAPQTNSEVARPGNPPTRPPCRKGRVRRKGRCVAKHRHTSSKRHRTRNANTDRRAGK